MYFNYKIKTVQKLFLALQLIKKIYLTIKAVNKIYLTAALRLIILSDSYMAFNQYTQTN